MKVLPDTCVWGGVVSELRACGHDVKWTMEWSKDPGDEEILVTAARERRVLVNLDKDFGELAIVHNKAHSGIARLVNLAAIEQAKVCIRVLDLFGEELLKGAIVTAEAARVRIRPPTKQER